METSRTALVLAIIINFSNSDSNVEILPADCDCRDWYGTCRHRGERWVDDETWSYACDGTNGTDAQFVACVTEPPMKDSVPVGANLTIGALWHSCDANTQRLKYDTGGGRVSEFFSFHTNRPMMVEAIQAKGCNKAKLCCVPNKNLVFDCSEPHCLVDGHVKKVHSEFREGRFQWLCLETGRWVVGCYYSNETHPNVYLKIGEYGYNGLIKHVCDRYGDYPGRVQYYAEVRKDVHVKHPTNKGINKNFPEPADLRLKEKVDRWLHESATMFVANDESLRGKVRYLPESRRQWPIHHH